MKSNPFRRPGAALALAAGLAAAAPALAPALAQDATPPFDARQKEAIDALVRQYILDHPEVVVEALQRYEEARQAAEAERQRAALATFATQLTADPRDPVIGNPQGDVTLVEFFDYRCPYCKRATETLAQLIGEDPNLRVVMKEFPILSQESVQAARAALAARDQGKYEAFHFALMEGGGGFTDEEILLVAEQVGLDTDALELAMRDPAIDALLREVNALAEQLGITGTPAFIIGGTLIPGAVGLEQLRAKVAEVRASKG
ncbi:MAG: DsbA family protein [Bacteroidota bacterium]|nr:DsbA family protein [Kiloniellaceae bacterium]